MHAGKWLMYSAIPAGMYLLGVRCSWETSGRKRGKVDGKR